MSIQWARAANRPAGQYHAYNSIGARGYCWAATWPQQYEAHPDEIPGAMRCAQCMTALRRFMHLRWSHGRQQTLDLKHEI